MSLTDEQRNGVIRILHHAFIMMRSGGLTNNLGRPKSKSRKSKRECKRQRKQMRKAHEKVVAFAEAMHNIPLILYNDQFDYAFHKRKIESYLDACPELQGYLNDLEEMAYGRDTSQTSQH